MELLKQLIPTLVTLSLALLVMSVGMSSARGELAYVLRRPSLLVRGVVAVNIIPVILAVVIVSIFPISKPVAAGLLVMAISPVPPLVPGKMMKFGGHSGYAYGLYTAMALLAIITVPVLGSFTAGYYKSAADFPPSVVAQNVFIGVVAPLAVGLALGRWLAPVFSHRHAPLIQKVSLVLVVVAFLPIIVMSWPTMMQLIGNGTVIAFACFVASVVTAAHFLGSGDIGDHATLAFAAGVRHPGIALALVGANHADKNVTSAILLLLLVGLLVLFPYQLFLKKRLAANACKQGISS